MITMLNKENRTDDIRGQLLCQVTTTTIRMEIAITMMRMAMLVRKMMMRMMRPCEKGRTSKLYIGAKLLLAVGAGSW